MAPHSTVDSFSMAPAITAVAARKQPLIPGIYVPTPCFFHDNEDEDIDTALIAQHAVRLARAGVAGLTVQGSNGEAAHLDHSERNIVTRTTRRALDAAGYVHMPIIVGCAAQSIRETVKLCNDAAASGGDYALVLPPAYYKANYTRESLLSYFTSVADRSPLPLVIYNFPAAAAGTDLDSDLLIELATHPNVVGAKLTCGNVGKIARLAAATSALTPHDVVPTTFKDSDSLAGANSTGTVATDANGAPPFLVLAGSADFLLPSLVVCASGALAGLANIAPRACVELYNAFRDNDVKRMRALQAVLARADWAVQKGGVVGTKSALQGAFGYGGHGRRPLPRWELTGPEHRANMDAFEEIIELEREL
jgi:4-hydroxy-2-oxoglutarate aldolase